MRTYIIHTGKLPYLLLILAPAILFFAGCGSGASGVPVEGTVNINGAPLEAGSITFVSKDGAVTGGDVISAGKYNVGAIAGLKPGDYDVKINWRKKTGRMIIAEDTGEKTEQIIEGLPAKFNSKTRLTAKLGPSNNTVDFDLDAK